jgi:hypothetical protein
LALWKGRYGQAFNGLGASGSAVAAEVTPTAADFEEVAFPAAYSLALPSADVALVGAAAINTTIDDAVLWLAQRAGNAEPAPEYSRLDARPNSPHDMTTGSLVVRDNALRDYGWPGAEFGRVQAPRRLMLGDGEDALNTSGSLESSSEGIEWDAAFADFE